MKTFKTIMVTFVVTVFVGLVGVGAFLFNEGIVTIERENVEHTKMVVVDGVVTEATSWKSLDGVSLKIDVVDGVRIDL